MQARMKEHQLSVAEIEELLKSAQVGRLGTLNANGYPYVVPVHFYFDKDVIYIHGLNKGQKIENLKANAKVSFEVDQMDGLILNDKACDVNTKYKSVIAFGKAQMVEDAELKVQALHNIVNKYTPQLGKQEYPENMLKATGIIAVTMEECSGKFYE